MRPIARAWDTERKTMEVINDFYWFEENGVHDWGGHGSNTNWIIDKPIGLKDKNGIKIYENDWVKFYRDGECFALGRVFWDTSNLAFRHTFYEAFNGKPEMDFQRPPKAFWINYDLECEVIGNLHENPKLLKGL